VRRTTILRVVALVALAAAALAVVAFVPVRPLIAESLDRVRNAGFAGLVIVGAMYTPASVLFIPAWPLTVGAGFAFGVLRGTLTASCGSVIGATTAFLAGRTLLRRVIEERISRNPRFAAIDRAVSENGFKIVLLTRLSPVLPFNLLNYAFGLTKVSLRDFVIASWIGMLPGTVLYVYLGSAAESIADLFSGPIDGGMARKALFFLGLVATVVVTAYVARIARRELGRAVGPAATASPGGEGARNDGANDGTPETGFTESARR
jgi:uncharacterized membrane protein YdjX (TVP38/TMEM64 family)